MWLVDLGGGRAFRTEVLKKGEMDFVMLGRYIEGLKYSLNDNSLDDHIVFLDGHTYL